MKGYQNNKYTMDKLCAPLSFLKIRPIGPDYREQVLTQAVIARVLAEKAYPLGWARYASSSGHSIVIETLGASAPLEELQKKFIFIPKNIIAAAKKHLAKAR
ncbi:transketolase [Candidatus Brocadia pituitae]|nr:transketolase [Candidatus Brocadia pituitae]